MPRTWLGALGVSSTPARRPGPEGEGTPVGEGWAGRACRGRAAAGRSGHKARQCQAWRLPPSRPPSIPPGRPVPCARGLGRSADPKLWSRGGGRPSEAGPQAVKEKNIPRPANCCSQLFFFCSSCLGEKKKKKRQRFLWRRMQKGCRILTISCTGVFPSRVWAQAWHGRAAEGAGQSI